jgi:TATA-binding protein-associated factor Taf7
MGPFQKRINRIISSGLNVDPEAVVEEEVEAVEATADDDDEDDEEDEKDEKEDEEKKEEKPAHEEL